MMGQIKLRLHESVIIISDELGEGYNQGDIIAYISGKDAEEKIKRLGDFDIIDGEVTGTKWSMGVGNVETIGVPIAKMNKLFKKAQNEYFKLEEKNKLLIQNLKDEIFPMVVITFYILKQIKMILRSMALGNIANEIENNELNVAWDLFQYLLKGMPSGSELLNKVNKDKFIEDYTKVFMLR